MDPNVQFLNRQLYVPWIPMFSFILFQPSEDSLDREFVFSRAVLLGFNLWNWCITDARHSRLEWKPKTLDPWKLKLMLGCKTDLIYLNFYMNSASGRS